MKHERSIVFRLSASVLIVASFFYVHADKGTKGLTHSSYGICKQSGYQNLNKIFYDSSAHVVITPYGGQAQGVIKRPLASLYQHKQAEFRFVFIVPSYNNAQWYKKNLESIFSQKYTNYHVIYIDDASPDGTAALVESFVKERGMQSRFTLIKNKERQYMAYNRYAAVHLCADTDICIALDGDDWLKDEYVLSFYNNIYRDKNVWMTYGSYMSFPSGKRGAYCAQIAREAILKNNIRAQSWTASHLKTCYAWLFKQINVESFQFENSFITGATDLAMMFPMLELAGGYSKFIERETCIYNCGNRDVVEKHQAIKNLKKRKKIGAYLRAQKPFTPIHIGKG